MSTLLYSGFETCFSPSTFWRGPKYISNLDFACKPFLTSKTYLKYRLCVIFKKGGPMVVCEFEYDEPRPPSWPWRPHSSASRSCA